MTARKFVSKQKHPKPHVHRKARSLSTELLNGVYQDKDPFNLNPTGQSTEHTTVK